jgi:hypothetical protein
MDAIPDVTKFYQRFNKIGPKALNKMYTEEQMDSIKLLTDMGRIATENPKQGQIFSFILRGFQLSAIAGTAYGLGKEEALTALFAPNLLARFLTSRTGNKLLTEGYQTMKAGASSTGSFSGRYLSELLRNKMEYDKEIEQHNAIIKRQEYADLYKKQEGSMDYMKSQRLEKGKQATEAYKQGSLNPATTVKPSNWTAP